MDSGEYTYIWQTGDWPRWRYALAALAGPWPRQPRQSLLLGRLADLGVSLRDQASLSVLTEDMVKTSEIESERLNVESVRSSIALRNASGRLPRRRGRPLSRLDRWRDRRTIAHQGGTRPSGFATLHPFDDGNGRIARASSDLLSARADGSH